MEKLVLYIHGMGGGGDSRIPSILRDVFDRSESDSPQDRRVKIVVRTYDFDPEVAAEQIACWVDELKPDIVIGESLGSLQAIRITGIPHLFVSPSLNAPHYLGRLAFLALIPGMTWMLDRIYKPREGDRQKLHFTFKVLRKYRKHRKIALMNSTRNGSRDFFYAFFGHQDHYRKSGIVSIKTWEKYFGKTYSMYDGTHFMEEEFVTSLLVPKIRKVLENNKGNKNV